MTTMNKIPAIALLALVTAGPAAAATGADTILAALTAEAKATDEAFAGFDAKRGASLFATRHAAGKPETPACTTCHGEDPLAGGQTRAGKPIEPMAASRTPNRYSEPRKVAKWFRRNCRSVLGRECTAREKGDFIVFMQTQ